MDKDSVGTMSMVLSKDGVAEGATSVPCAKSAVVLLAFAKAFKVFLAAFLDALSTRRVLFFSSFAFALEDLRIALMIPLRTCFSSGET
jgi:hypothetical protein